MGRLRSAAAGMMGVLLLAAGALAAAQGYPSKSVRLVVPFPPGQATDIVARLLAEQLAKNWGQQVYVENRGGGGGIPGMLAGREAAPDGYTLTFGTSGTIGANPGLYAKLPYDPPRDFAMVGGVFVVPLMFVAHPGFPYTTIKDLVAAAKREPGKISWAFAGTGTSQHLTGELFKVRAGVSMEGIPYKGSGPAVTDLMGGQVPLMVDSLASALPHVKGGKIRAIAMTTLQRVPQLPEVPTVAESGYPGFDGNGWAGLVVPAATPRDIVERIGAEVRRVMTDPAMQARVIERGAIPDPRGPAEWGEFVKAEIAKWGDIAKKANIRLD